MGSGIRDRGIDGRRPLAGGRSVWGDAALLGCGQVIAQAANLAALAWIARRLGAGDFGLIQVAVAAGSYFLVAAELGLFTEGVRALARLDDEAEVRERVRDQCGLLLVLALVAGALGLLLLPLLPAYGRDPVVFFLYAAAVLPQARMLDWAALGRSLPGIAAVGRALRSLSYAALVLLLAGTLDGAAGQPLRRWVPVLFLASLVLGNVVVLVRLRRRLGGPLGPSWRGRSAWPARLRVAAPIGGAHLTRRLLFNADLLLLGAWAAAPEAGRYAAAAKLAFPLVVGAEVVQGALLPRLSRAWSEGGGAYGRTLRRQVAGVAAVWGAAAVAGALWGERMMRPLFGEEYVAAGPLLRTLFPAYLLLALGIQLHEAQIASDRARGALVPLAAAAVVLVGCGFLWIPAAGAEGAARAVLVAQAVYAVGGLARCRRALTE